MNELATEQSPMRCVDLFAGAGGGLLAGHLLGWRTVCSVEWDPYAASVLVQRQNDGCFPAPGFPIWDDVQTFDGRPWRGRVDVISGGFPCQDISTAGKGGGLKGTRSSLWGQFKRLICEVKPLWVFVENVPGLLTNGMGRVLGDLADIGYDAEWEVLSAADVGAPHLRKRVFIVAHTQIVECNGRNDNSRICQQGGTVSKFGNRSRTKDVADAISNATGATYRSSGRSSEQRWDDESVGQRDTVGSHTGDGSADVSDAQRERENWWTTEPDVGRVANGVPRRVDRLKGLGNAVVPQSAEWVGRKIVSSET